VIPSGAETVIYPENQAWLDWTKDKLTVSGASDLVDTQPEMLAITGCPMRVIAAVKAAEWLSGAEGPKTAGQMREALEISEAVVDPQGLVGLGVTPSRLTFFGRILVPKVATM